MKKKVIVFSSRITHPAVWPNTMSLASAISQSGFDVLLCDINENRFATLFYCQKMLREQPDSIAFTLGIADCGLNAPDLQRNGEWRPVSRPAMVPHVSFLFDTPYNFPAISGTLQHDMPRHIITLMDRDSLRYMDLFHPEKHKLFLPVAGTESDAGIDELLSRPRPIGLLYCASNWGIDTVQAWHLPEWTDSSSVPLLDDIAEYMMTHPVTTGRAIEAVLHLRGLDEPEYLQRLQPYFWPLLRYIKPYRRQKALSLLLESDIPVHVIGDYWKDTPFAQKLTIHPRVNYDEFLQLIDQSKAIFSDMGEFNNGGHERVFTAMLHGTAVVSEYSQYLAEEFKADDDIIFYDFGKRAQNISHIPKLLSDDAYRERMVRRAYQKAYARHRWQNRARALIDALALLYPERFA